MDVKVKPERVEVGSILDTLNASMASYPKAMGRIAKYVVEYPEVAIRQSIHEISEIARTSQASVVRLSTLLGYDGFRSFKLALTAEVAQKPTLNIGTEKSSHPVIERTRDAMFATTHEIYRAIDPDQLADVARLLAGAARVDIFGLGGSGIIADYLAFRLLQLGISAQSYRDSSMALGLAVTFKAGSIAIGVSRSGLSEETALFLKTSERAGARTLAICDSNIGPVPDAGQNVLLTSTVSPRDGDTGLTMAPRMFLIELLASYIAYAKSEGE